MAVHYRNGEVKFEGRVISVRTEYGVRVMSDVWDDTTCAEVLNDYNQIEKILLHCGYHGELATAEVDATPEVLATIANLREIERQRAEARAEANRQYLAREEQEAAKARVLHSIGKGDIVRVYKGRKVPVGTIGKVIWEGDSAYGRRLGVKDDEGTVHWVAADNVQRANATEIEAAAAGDWVAYERWLNVTAQARVEAVREEFPVRGCQVRTACGKVGSVFWKADDGSRVGVRVGPDRNDVVWANANTLTAV
jgi:hypothetical protein